MKVSLVKEFHEVDLGVLGKKSIKVDSNISYNPTKKAWEIHTRNVLIQANRGDLYGSVHPQGLVPIEWINWAIDEMIKEAQTIPLFTRAKVEVVSGG
jgi:hypothetical protein